MSDGTKIEWADATVNAVNGCSVLSPGCTNCYAMRLAGTRMKHHPTRVGLTQDSKAGPVWTGEVRLHEPALLQPLAWKRPRRIFWNAHGDLFHENVPDEWIDKVFAVCALTPQHQHMILTKRSTRMREYFAAEPRDEIISQALALASGVQFPKNWPLPNVWLGTSVEDQPRADERIPELLATPAAVRFVSAEPLLGNLDLGCLQQSGREVIRADILDALNGHALIGDEGGDNYEVFAETPKLDWVIAGGESGPGARPMHPDWTRSLRDQCIAAGVAFHFKQWGEWLPGENYGAQLAKWQDGEYGQHSSCCGRPERQRPDWRHFGNPGEFGAFALKVGKKRAGRLLDGRTWDEVPHA